MKTIFAGIAGYAVWTIVWFLGNFGFRALAFTPKEPGARIEVPGALFALLLLSALASLSAGVVVRLISPSKAASYLCAAALVLTCIAVQWGFREVFPLWYHVAFPLLIVPLLVLGRRIVA
jgi:hypothetical protein